MTIEFNKHVAGRSGKQSNMRFDEINTGTLFEFIDKYNIKHVMLKVSYTTYKCASVNGNAYDIENNRLCPMKADDIVVPLCAIMIIE